MRKKKSMIKEIFIFIILLILVLLILAVTLYDYIPSNVNVAEVRKYTADSKTTSIKQEIAYTNGGDASDYGTDALTSLETYSIDSSDLSVYSSKHLYNRGNSNPFEYASDAQSSTQGTSTNASSGTTVSTGDNTASGTEGSETAENTSSSTTGTFFESSTSK